MDEKLSHRFVNVEFDVKDGKIEASINKMLSKSDRKINTTTGCCDVLKRHSQ